jgi:hypothetical protein
MTKRAGSAKLPAFFCPESTSNTPKYAKNTGQIEHKSGVSVR